MLQARLGLSQRRACQITGQARSTQRYRPAEPDPDRQLRAWLRAFARAHPRWGYRRAHAVLIREGHHHNRKKIARLWREEGLRVPARKRKRQRLGISTTAAARLRAEHPDHVWALDYQFDVTSTGRTIKLLHVVDEFTRESLSDLAAYNIDADATVAVLDTIAAHRGHPKYIRCDNGPELTANALRDWCRFTGTGTSYIEPGSPWENPWAETYGGKSATNYWRSSNSTPCSKPRCLPPTGEPSTTPTVPTPRWACSPPPSSPGNGGPSTSHSSHNEWTTKRGPVTVNVGSSAAEWGGPA
jgi:putative transposase